MIQYTDQVDVYNTGWILAAMLIITMVLGVSALSAIEMGLELGFSRIDNIQQGTLWNVDATQDHLPVRGYIGLNGKYRVNPWLKVGAKAIYNHRDYSEQLSGLEAKGAYIDVMLHPVINIHALELFAGPTLAMGVGQKHKGGFPWYTDQIVSDFAAFVPGWHAGVRFSSETDGGVNVEVTYNRDLQPFSKALGIKKYQEKMMLGVNYRFLNRDINIQPIWRNLRYIETEQRVNQGIAMSTKKEDFIVEYNAAYELVKRIGPLGLGAEFNLSAGSILPEESFGVWTTFMTGPQLGFKLGVFEPYYQKTWGVVPMFAFEKDHPATGLHPSIAWEAGLRIHASDEIGIDFRYQEKTFYDSRKLSVIGIGVSINENY